MPIRSKQQPLEDRGEILILGDVDSNLARGIEETARRQERRLEDLKRRAENGRGSGNSLADVAPLVEFARG